MFKNKWLLTFALIFGLAFVLFIWFGNADFVYQVTREDGFIEYLTAFFYLIGVILGILTLINNKKLMFFAVLWTILCFVFLGEETSWFQRVFNYSVPAVEGVNAQKEFNFHNLQIFKGEDLFADGKIRKEGIINFLKSTQNIYRIGFFGYFLILPLLTFNKWIKKLLVKLDYFKPNVNFIIVLLIVLVLSFVLAIMSEEHVKMAMAETREMLYAFFIFLYLGIYYYSPRKTDLS